MDTREIFERLDRVFQDVFDDDTIHVTPTTTADDIEDWDSLEHITLISAVRELFGVGTLFGVQVMPAGYPPMDILVKPAGGFIVLGLLLALMNKLLPKKA